MYCVLTFRQDDVWNGADDPARPRNWSMSRKLSATFILSAFAFIQPLAETMLAPLQRRLSSDLSITSGYQWILVNSLILIGVGFGPLLIAPASEAYGRRIAILGGSAMFIIWNTCCGFACTLSQMFAFRLLAGFGACTADAVAGGVIGDIWPAHQRGRAFAVFMAAPLLGPGIGPIVGAYISTAISWKWVFWITSMVTAAFFVTALLFLKETYEPRLAHLHRMRYKSQERALDNNRLARKEELGDAQKSITWLLWMNLQRPLRMLATQLIIQLIAVYMALLYGTMFLFLYMYSTLWAQQYGQGARVSSLNYISAAIGYIVGVQGKQPMP